MIKKYFEPTPVFFRKIGDSLLLVGTTLTTYGIAQHDDRLALIALWCGVIGKVITNFFSDQTVTP